MKKIFLLFVIFFLLLSTSCSNFVKKPQSSEKIAAKKLIGEKAETATRFSQKHQIRYYYEHKFLPKVFFSNPVGMINSIQQNGFVYFQKVFDDLQSGIEAKDKFDSSEINFSSVKEGNYNIVLIKLPQPIIPPEAYYVAMVVNKDKAEEARYFTLEKLASYGSEKGEAIFCGWTKEKRHLNYGIATSKVPKKTDFLYLIRQKLAKNL